MQQSETTVKLLADLPVSTGSTAHHECPSGPLLMSQNQEVLQDLR